MQWIWKIYYYQVMIYGDFVKFSDFNLIWVK